VSDAFQREIAWLGIQSSPSFVRAPEGNGCAERFIRTLKEQLLWVRRFKNVEELRVALREWLEKYNEKWLVERHSYRAPAQVRRDFLAVQAVA
jgi:transposase InsO family protein